MNEPARRAAMLCALLTSTALAAPAAAQSVHPSAFQHVDSNGVDLTDGSFNFSFVEGTIGAGDSSLAISRTFTRAGWSDGMPGRLHRSLFPTNKRIVLDFGNRAEYFTLSPSGWTPDRGDGARLSGGGSSYTYTGADGTEIEYGTATSIVGSVTDGGIRYCIDDADGECALLPLSVTRPNGRRLDIRWQVAEACTSGTPDPTLDPNSPTPGQSCSYYPRLASLRNEAGYVAQFFYADNSAGGAPPPAWFRRTSARLVNSVADCDPEAAGCTLSQSWPTITYAEPAAGVTQVTDPANRTWLFSSSGTSFTIQRPGSSSPNVTVARSNNVVTSVTADGVTTNYSRNVSGATATMTATNALNQATTVVSDLTVGRPTSVTDALNRTTQISYDSFGRPLRVTAPEGNYTEYQYDARGNVTLTSHVPKPGSTDPTITTSATYPATCTNVVTCNLPLTSTDARGNVTTYTYDPVHGGLLTVTGPAVTVGNAAVQPQVRTTYTQTGGVHLPTRVATCQTTSSCTNGADEVRTTIGYNANLLPETVSSGNGTGTLVSASTAGYDRFGNVATVDGPLAGSGDTVHYRYDAARQRVGAVSPDPDGAGPLPHRAERVTYRPDGQVSRVETGTVGSQSDADWAAMAVLDTTDTVFDAQNRPAARSQAAGGAMHSVVQTSYDAAGRPDCVALRMNPATWTNLPASACTPATAGANGPDRITRTVRNAAGEATQIRTAVGTPLETAERTTTFSANGQPLTVTDGENNRTSYEYDGHGRLRRTYFPVAAQGANQSNAADYEELGYDAAGNAVSRRNRAGEVASYTFDALGRMTVKDLPGAEPDVVYAYDLLGRLVSASQPGHVLSFTYDALGRRLTQTNPMGTIGSTWDAAGRRIRITHPGGYYVDQDYLVTGEMSAIRENGATSGLGVIATFGYDTRGRRSSLTFGNGVVTTYAYDPASRLETLGHDLAGTARDLTLGFTYNPAGQILSNSRSNDAYSWTGTPAGTTLSTANGLNQLAAHNGAAPGYDARGNLASEGGRTFSYSSENLLTGMTNPTRTFGWTYDPLMRLYHQTTSGLNSRTYLMDGDNALVTHLNGSFSIRAVYGPGENEILYSLDNLARRRWYSADERGSVVATSDASGVAGVPLVYDEYGNAANLSYQHSYTGALILGVSGLNYMRARIYDPSIGRFLQTDPIGYGDGMNMYAYVGGDPVNATDPSGLSVRIGSLLCSGAAKAYEDAWHCVSERGDGQMTPALSLSGGVGGNFEDGGGTSEIIITGTRLMPDDRVVITGPGTRPFGPAVRVSSIRADMLFRHFLGGSGRNICLTRDQFLYAAAHHRPVHGTQEGLPNGRYRQNVTFDNFDLQNGLGTATMTFDEDGHPVGLYDLYNMDRKAPGVRPDDAEFATSVGNLFYNVGARDFRIGYPCV